MAGDAPRPRATTSADTREQMRALPNGALVHESSYVDAGAEIGAGTRVWHFCHVMAGASIGDACNLGQNVVVMPGVRLGRNVKVQNNVSLYQGVECEDDVFLGPSMVFTNVLTPRSAVSRKHEFRGTVVRRGASIGANATIVCGHEVGAYAFVAAGAVVTHDVTAHALVAGVPARRIGWMCRCGERLPGSAALRTGQRRACPACGEAYVDQRTGIVAAADASGA